MSESPETRAAGNGDFIWHRNAWIKMGDSLATEATAPPETEAAPAVESHPGIPPDGWPLREAFRHLFLETHEQIVAAALFAAEIGGDEGRIRHYLPIVWKMMAKRIEKGEVIATGCGPGATTRGEISPSIVSFLTPDLSKNCLCQDDLVFRAVRFMSAVSKETADGNGATDKTGAPGAPSSMHLVEAEMKRRASTGEMFTTSCQQEAEFLSEWVKSTHPSLRPVTAKTIKNQLGNLYKRLTEGVFPE